MRGFGADEAEVAQEQKAQQVFDSRVALLIQLVPELGQAEANALISKYGFNIAAAAAEAKANIQAHPQASVDTTQMSPMRVSKRYAVPTTIAPPPTVVVNPPPTPSTESPPEVIPLSDPRHPQHEAWLATQNEGSNTGWYIGGAVLLAGIGYYLYSRKSGVAP